MRENILGGILKISGAAACQQLVTAKDQKAMEEILEDVMKI